MAKESGKVSDLIEDHYSSNLKIVEKEDSVDTMYGVSAVYLTRDQVNSLLEGKCGYFEDGEYATIVYIKG